MGGSRARTTSSSSSVSKKKKQPVWLVKTQLWCYEKLILVHLVAMMSLEPIIQKLWDWRSRFETRTTREQVRDGRRHRAASKLLCVSLSKRGDFGNGPVAKTTVSKKSWRRSFELVWDWKIGRFMKTWFFRGAIKFLSLSYDIWWVRYCSTEAQWF